MKDKTNFYTKPIIVCILALVCCTLWGSAFPCIKIGYALFQITGEDTMSQMVFAGYRFTIAGCMVIAIGSVMHKRWIHPKKDTILLAVKLGCVQTVFQYVFFYMGLAHTTGVKASIITAANVFFAILLSIPMFHEYLDRKKWFGCFLGFAGVILINMAGTGLDLRVSFMGEGAMLLSAFAAALASVLIKSYSQKEDTFVLCGYQFFFGGIVLATVGRLSGGAVTHFTPQSVLLLLYMGLISAVAYTLWSILLKYNPVGKVAVFGFANPLVGVILSALLLGEKNQAFTASGMVALLLVCAGIWIVNKE